MKYDSVEAINWNDGLKFCENLNLINHNDQRVPDIKELQSILDYTRSLDTTSSAAFDPIFDITEIIDEGDIEMGHFSGHLQLIMKQMLRKPVMAFGEALGWIISSGSSSYTLLDVRGAGAQRSDPKDGDPDDYPHEHGPQGDVIRIQDYEKCVRGQATGFSTTTTYISFLA